ncbi:16770_t:CDS:2, partial [Cetraspora pellucida]
NHSGCTTSITHLYQLGTPNSTLISITEHKSESSVRIYSHPSEQQKKINNSNIQTIEPNNQDNKDRTIELNNQDNEDLNEQNIQIIEQSDQDATNSINHDFQTHAPLSNIQINSIPPTDPGIYGPGNPHPNSFKKNPTLGGRQLLKRKKKKLQIINNYYITA